MPSKGEVPSLVGASVRSVKLESDYDEASYRSPSRSAHKVTRDERTGEKHYTTVNELASEGALLNDEFEYDELLDDTGKVKQGVSGAVIVDASSSPSKDKPASAKVASTDDDVLAAKKDPSGSGDESSSSFVVVDAVSDKLHRPDLVADTPSLSSAAASEGSSIYSLKNQDSGMSLEDLIDSQIASMSAMTSDLQKSISEKRMGGRSRSRPQMKSSLSQSIIPTSVIENDSLQQVPAGAPEGMESPLVQSRSQSMAAPVSRSKDVTVERPHLAKGDSYKGTVEYAHETRTGRAADRTLDTFRSFRAGSRDYLRSVSRSRSRVNEERQVTNEDLLNEGVLINDELDHVPELVDRIDSVAEEADLSSRKNDSRSAFSDLKRTSISIFEEKLNEDENEVITSAPQGDVEDEVDIIEKSENENAKKSLADIEASAVTEQPTEKKAVVKEQEPEAVEQKAHEISSLKDEDSVVVGAPEGDVEDEEDAIKELKSDAAKKSLAEVEPLTVETTARTVKAEDSETTDASIVEDDSLKAATISSVETETSAKPADASIVTANASETVQTTSKTDDTEKQSTKVGLETAITDNLNTSISDEETETVKDLEVPKSVSEGEKSGIQEGPEGDEEADKEDGEQEEEKDDKEDDKQEDEEDVKQEEEQEDRDEDKTVEDTAVEPSNDSNETSISETETPTESVNFDEKTAADSDTKSVAVEESESIEESVPVNLEDEESDIVEESVKDTRPLEDSKALKDVDPVEKASLNVPSVETDKPDLDDLSDDKSIGQLSEGVSKLSVADATEKLISEIEGVLGADVTKENEDEVDQEAENLADENEENCSSKELESRESVDETEEPEEVTSKKLETDESEETVSKNEPASVDKAKVDDGFDDLHEPSKDEIIELLKDEPVYIFTSLAGGGFFMPQRTNKLATILTANRIPFTYRDLGTDEEARNVWRRYSKGRSPPGVVRGKDDIIGNWEEIEEANEDYRVRELIYETL
ncbi:unnamed protein product [Cyberlindnera jadinii]|uniref:Uncharacterized protein n=1 Tax=Cyberlindnera jadinii (strain ATCC 18201 / CBS 1600 / BCRC 20928 / JCM 3617 / NBRC 0987 / NRRL Y-1542) TaxID=983966 RepID=A0A0H5C3T7_CYBJN|nr:hypothetical protein CYBJADRAFT_160666 [Cyberlindnera jadinii NRRL Y-1542]ODV75218.1 hypothetical protein CYBJADRAFT_160666 [Cyberlindnera jadinii NRRL Y-1542]CEP22377.1 unnamed protein product [Cyberlindnera jadinii]